MGAASVAVFSAGGVAMPYELSARCPDCSKSLKIRTRKADGEKFLGCTGYPRCTYATDYDEAINELGKQIAKWRSMYISASLDTNNAGSSPDIASDLRSIIRDFHPDKGETISATKVTARLNALRDKVLGK